MGSQRAGKSAALQPTCIPAQLPLIFGGLYEKMSMSLAIHATFCHIPFCKSKFGPSIGNNLVPKGQSVVVFVQRKCCIFEYNCKSGTVRKTIGTVKTPLGTVTKPTGTVMEP